MVGSLLNLVMHRDGCEWVPPEPWQIRAALGWSERELTRQAGSGEMVDGEWAEVSVSDVRRLEAAEPLDENKLELIYEAFGGKVRFFRGGLWREVLVS